MNHDWRPARHVGERRKHHPIRAWMPVITVLASMLAVCTYHYIEVWTPLQRFYFGTYILTGFRTVSGMTNSGHYELLAVTTKNGSHWAVDGEVTEARTESGGKTLALTREALKHGGLHLVLLTVESDNANLHDFLRQEIYQDQTLTVLLRPALWSGLAVLFLWPASMLFLGAVEAYRRSHGRKLSVPGLASPQGGTRQNPLCAARPDRTHQNSPVAALTKVGLYREATPMKVEPHEPRTVVRTAESVDGDARREIIQDEFKQEPEHKSKPKPARKERYFQ